MKLQIFAGMLALLMAPCIGADAITAIASLKDINFDTIPDDAVMTVDLNVMMEPRDVFLLNKRSEQAITLWESLMKAHPSLSKEDWEKVAFAAALGSPRQAPDQDFIDAVGLASERGVKALAVDGYVFSVLDNMEIQPTYLVVVDSHVELLEMVKAECEQRGVDFVGYVCAPTQVKEWNEELVRFQLEHVIANNEWLTDEKALELLAD